MAYSKESNAKMNAMDQFNKDHWTKDQGETMAADGKYTEGEMRNPEHLKKSVDMLAAYAKKNKMQYP
jgi:hypothetical protein